MKKNLSIIIPHFNSSTLLEKLLSTIPQNQEDIETIVIDDKSEESHLEYIERLKAKYPFQLFHNETSEKGAGVARNIGLNHARGEWVLFADSDDYLTENFYKSTSKYFNSDYDVVFFKPTSIYIDTGEVADRHNNFVSMLEKYQRDPSLKNELNLRYNIPNPISKLIKRSFLLENQITFDEVIASNDVMFSTKVGYFMVKFAISENTIYVITRNYGSLTANINENFFDTRFRVTIDYHNFLKQHLTMQNFKLLDISGHGRSYLVKSMRYGSIKVLHTWMILYKNDFKFFHYKWFNPLHIINKTIAYKKKNKRNIKYMIDDDA